ncbi:MAG TPA: tetraacyldisaccharide 4'-kinase [Anaeromyxobacter sp.]|nr:tetraacyldisaccharide 4'-kinase [Anaeromyxobacter sp.]
MSLVESIWWGPAPGAAGRLLLPPLVAAEAAFRLGAAVRGALYERGILRAARAGAPVVSIGNLAVGGAGKTPAAIAVGRRLLARGRRLAVLSRGYGATRADARVVCDGARLLLGADQGGDEPVLLARRLPGARVLCGPRRAELARTAVEALDADALLLDDGFQHRALARDLDVVVLDAASPFGNGRLLPAGPNREPRGALRRAGLVWLSRADQAAPGALEPLRALAREATGRAPIESRHAPVDVVDGTLSRSLGLEALRGRRVMLLAGVARPAGVRRTVEALGAEVAAEARFPDHHRFSGGELDAALRAAREARCELVVTTEKDAVRLDRTRAEDPRLCAVRIEAEVVRGGDVLDAAIDAALVTFAASVATSTSTSTATPTATPTATATATPTATAAPTRRR